MKIIYLTKGIITKVDDEDYKWLNEFNWCYADGGYAKRTINYNTSFMHREIMMYYVFNIFKKEVDHIDRDGLNNQKYNLRIATRLIQQINRGIFINNTSGYKGVSKHYDKWAARIKVNYKLLHIGRYSSKKSCYSL